MSESNLKNGALSSTAKLLLYRLSEDSEEGRLFRLIAREHNCEIVELLSSDLDADIKTIYSRGQLKQEKQMEDPDNGRGFCVLCGFTKAAFDALLNAWKAAGVGRPVLKAVATEHNQSWPLRELFAELAREHELTLAYVALRKRVLGFEAALEKQGIKLPEADTELDPAVREKMSSLADAKRLLADIRAIQTVDEIHKVDQAFRQAWKLPD